MRKYVNIYDYLSFKYYRFMCLIYTFSFIFITYLYSAHLYKHYCPWNKLNCHASEFSQRKTKKTPTHNNRKNIFPLGTTSAFIFKWHIQVYMCVYIYIYMDSDNPDIACNNLCNHAWVGAGPHAPRQPHARGLTINWLRSFLFFWVFLKVCFICRYIWICIIIYIYVYI